MGVLRPEWYIREVPPEIDLNAPGIYEWRIEGLGLYVGKALKLADRIRAYPNNVRRMIEGLHWHGNPNRQYRLIHQALKEAHDLERVVRVTVLENCLREERRHREDYWIALRIEEELRGGPRVLNATHRDIRG